MTSPVFFLPPPGEAAERRTGAARKEVGHRAPADRTAAAAGRRDPAAGRPAEAGAAGGSRTRAGRAEPAGGSRSRAGGRPAAPAEEAGRRDPADRTVRAAGAARRTGPAGCSSFWVPLQILMRSKHPGPVTGTTWRRGAHRYRTNAFRDTPATPLNWARDRERSAAATSARLRTADPVRAGRGRGAAVRALGGAGLLRGGREEREAAVHDRHPAAERHGQPAPRARLPAHADGRADSAQAHAGLRVAVAAGHGPRGHRHPERRRARTRQGGQVPPRPGPGGVRRARLAVEGRVRRQDPRPDAPARRRRRLEPRALHHGRGPVPGRPDHLQAALRRRVDLPRRAHHQLVPALSHRDLGHRGRVPGRRRRARLHEVRGGGRHHRRRHDPRRDDARRHRRRRPPRRRALQAPRRPATSSCRSPTAPSRSSPTPTSTPSSAPARSR